MAREIPLRLWVTVQRNEGRNPGRLLPFFSSHVSGKKTKTILLVESGNRKQQRNGKEKEGILGDGDDVGDEPF